MHIAIPYSLHASVIFPSWTLPPGCATYCDVDVNEENGNRMQIYGIRSFDRYRKELLLLSLSIGRQDRGRRMAAGYR